MSIACKELHWSKHARKHLQMKLVLQLASHLLLQETSSPLFSWITDCQARLPLLSTEISFTVKLH